MSNIRRETKIIQSLLKEIYPNKKFSIQLKQPSSYVSNSDKIKIKCPEDVFSTMIVIPMIWKQKSL